MGIERWWCAARLSRLQGALGMRNDLYDSRAQDINILSGRFGTSRKILEGNYTIPQFGPCNLFFDGNGADRDIIMPSLIEGGGLFYVLNNVGQTNLNIKDASGTLIAVLTRRQQIWMTSSEDEWMAGPSVAGAAGAGHMVGLVPDPGAVSGATRFLREDMTWGSVFSAGIVDAFKFVTDGTNTAEGTGPDTLKVRSDGGTIAPVVTNNHATHGDTINFDVVPGAINHNALLNYAADQHVAHTGVSLTAGLGLTGGGDISTSRSFAVAFSGLTAQAPALTDYAVFWPANNSAGALRALWSEINALLIHNNLTGYVANEHIDHTGVSVVAGMGLSGGGAINVSRTLNLDFTELETGEAIAAADLIPFYDDSEADHNTTPFSTFNAALDHNVLANYVANQHIDHSTVSITAGAGLTGGGTIAATRSLEVGAGSGITVDADAVRLADITGPTVYGRTSGSGVPQQLTQAQLTSLINVFTAALSGAVPAPTTSTGKFLKDDATWATPAGGGDVVGPAAATDNAFARFDTATGKLLQNSSATLSDTGGPTWGARTVSKIVNHGSTSKTIATGAITLLETDTAILKLDTEGAAATDDLDTINGGVSGDIIYLRTTSSARDVVVKHGTGNISLDGNADYTISSTQKGITLFLDGATWRDLNKL
jgi:hypothetical protein